MRKTTTSCEKCFTDFKESLEELRDTIRSSNKDYDNLMHQKRIIRSFEITHELALQTMNEYLKKMGRGPYSGSRDTTVDAFDEDLIDDGKGWLDMIIERIKYNPLYPEEQDNTLTQNIVKKHVPLFLNFERKMQDVIT